MTFKSYNLTSISRPSLSMATFLPTATPTMAARITAVNILLSFFLLRPEVKGNYRWSERALVARRTDSLCQEKLSSFLLASSLVYMVLVRSDWDLQTDNPMKSDSCRLLIFVYLHVIRRLSMAHVHSKFTQHPAIHQHPWISPGLALSLSSPLPAPLSSSNLSAIYIHTCTLQHNVALNISIIAYTIVSATGQINTQLRNCHFRLPRGQRLLSEIPSSSSIARACVCEARMAIPGLCVRACS